MKVKLTRCVLHWQGLFALFGVAFCLNAMSWCVNDSYESSTTVYSGPLESGKLQTRENSKEVILLITYDEGKEAISTLDRDIAKWSYYYLELQEPLHVKVSRKGKVQYFYLPTVLENEKAQE